MVNRTKPALRKRHKHTRVFTALSPQTLTFTRGLLLRLPKAPHVRVFIVHALCSPDFRVTEAVAGPAAELADAVDTELHRL